MECSSHDETCNSDNHWRYDHLIESCRGRYEPIRTVVVHPCDDDSIQGPVQAAAAGLIVPILVGPKKRVQQAAAKAGVDISGFRLVDVEHSHAAAVAGVDLVRAGEGEALMKGSLHTDELMGAVVHRERGLRTARRISHVFVMDIPEFPRPLFITDAAINIAPTLEVKQVICQNAIDLAIDMGIQLPRVAVLSAVETVNPGIPSTIDAAALSKMADRGQIIGGLVDGPFAYDNAISVKAAKGKNIGGPVAGMADILLVPDLEAGNMLAKQLTFQAHAEGAGVVLGARVPVILTSRADNARTRMASCAVAMQMVEARRKRALKVEA
ncbi:MAG: bifunctional enoyl-CoA hydratase/phosphate acetyltransferase [Magnetococcales bacterium]|nr:bifunctional enoyl-CoA hydratase/phosphate acetyltransferase [Magnetococcales bacterium]